MKCKKVFNAEEPLRIIESYFEKYMNCKELLDFGFFNRISKDKDESGKGFIIT